MRLDLRTDADGVGHAETDVPFTFETASPRSVVIHDGAATEAGATGAACITLPAR